MFDAQIQLFCTNHTIECMKLFSTRYYDANETYYNNVDGCIKENFSPLNEVIEKIQPVLDVKQKKKFSIVPFIVYLFIYFYIFLERKNFY